GAPRPARRDVPPPRGPRAHHVRADPRAREPRRTTDRGGPHDGDRARPAGGASMRAAIILFVLHAASAAAQDAAHERRWAPVVREFLGGCRARVQDDAGLSAWRSTR